MFHRFSFGPLLRGEADESPKLAEEPETWRGRLAVPGRRPRGLQAPLGASQEAASGQGRAKIISSSGQMRPIWSESPRGPMPPSYLSVGLAVTSGTAWPCVAISQRPQVLWRHRSGLGRAPRHAPGGRLAPGAHPGPAELCGGRCLRAAGAGATAPGPRAQLLPLRGAHFHCALLWIELS